MNDFPPEFDVSIDQIGRDAPVLILGCLSCGVHHWFPSGTSFDRLATEVMIHTEVHLAEGLTGGAHDR